MMISISQFLAVIWTLYGFNLACTIGRVVLRWRAQRKYVLEDIFAFTGFIILTALTAVISVAVPRFYMAEKFTVQAMQNSSTSPPVSLDELAERTTLALKLMFAQMLLFWTTVWAGKFSLLVFFRRMVIGLPRYLRIFWVVFVLVSIAFLGCVASNFFTCQPLHKYWSSTGCSDPINVKRADLSIKLATAADVSADILIMLLPLKLLWNLHISHRQKLGLACLFCLGIIVIVFAFVRLFIVTDATQHQLEDPTKLAEGPLLLALWSQIEAAVAITVANLPAFRSLLRSNGSNIQQCRPCPRISYPHLSSGTHHSGETKDMSTEQESLQQFQSQNSLEMQSVQSESLSLDRCVDNATSKYGIMRTREFEIHSAHVPVGRQENGHHVRAFATHA